MSLSSLKKIHHFINGVFCPPHSDRYLDNLEPATGSMIGQVADGCTQDLELAISAANQAFPEWARTNVAVRSQWLMKIADAIEARADIFAATESQDTGKPLRLARDVDIPRVIDNFRFFAHAITQFSTHAYPMEQHALNYTLQQPLGIVACIAPWNLPLYLLSWKIAPALAAGNCVIAKPSEFSPASAHLLAMLLDELKFPKGVLNILHGRGAEIGQAIVAHPDIHAISFTGGTATGAAIAEQAAPKFKKLTLELGGKNPSIVFADADLMRAVPTLVRAAFSNQGQICLCGSRILVERSIYESFKRAFIAHAKKLVLGDPLEPNTDVGALISQAHLKKVLDYIELAHQEGGRLLSGGERVMLEGRCRDGYFVAPTVFENLSYDCRVNQEEIFGPIATLIPFDNEAQAIVYANSTRFGLSASLWSDNVHRCHRVAHALQAGVVWINSWLLRDLRTPFGGVKDSGIGREGGFEALRFFTETKTVCVAWETSINEH